MDCQPAMVLRRSDKVSRTSVVCTGQAGASVRLLELVSWYGRDKDIRLGTIGHAISRAFAPAAGDCARQCAPL